MITLKQIADVLRNYKKERAISDIKITPDGCVRSQLENHINPSRPYTLTVQPIVDKQVLRLRIPKIAKIGLDDSATTLLLMANAGFSYGSIGVDCRNVTYQINHLCRSRDDNAPSPEVIEKLLDGVADSLQGIEITIVLSGMLDAGIPRDCADNILDILFPEQEDDEAAEDEPDESPTSLNDVNQNDNKTVENERT